MRLVVDASVALAWVLPGEITPRTQELHERVKQDGAVSSHIWRLEVMNVVMQSERSARITESDTGRISRFLDAMPVVIDVGGLDHVFGAATDLARRYRLTTYDASYLELAIRLALPLASDDGDLRDAAVLAGVEVL